MTITVRGKIKHTQSRHMSIPDGGPFQKASMQIKLKVSSTKPKAAKGTKFPESVVYTKQENPRQLLFGGTGKFFNFIKRCKGEMS